jgi:hypothetical protein
VADDPNQSGRALLIPSYLVSSGRLVGTRPGDAERSEDPDEVATLQRRYKNDRLHLIADGVWTQADLDALELLAARGLFVIAEGGLDSREAVAKVVSAGAKVLALPPSFIASEREFLARCEVGILGEVGSPRHSKSVVEEMRPVLSGGFEGVIVTETTATGADVAAMLELVGMLNYPHTPLVIARLQIDDAGAGVALLQAMAPLNVSSLVDGPFLMDFVRIGRSEIVVETFGEESS